MSVFSGLGTLITNAGHAIGAPDIGLGRFLGSSSALPGLIQGVNPGTYQGVGAGSSTGNGHYSFGAPTGLGQAAPAPSAPSGGGYSAGGGGGVAAYDPNTDPNLVAQNRNNIYGDQNQINSLYGAINGQLQAYGQDKRGQIDQNYATQYANNDKSYAGANDQTNAGFTGRGAFDSSYRGNALQQNQDAYNQSNTTLHQSQDQNYADLGNTLNSVKSQLDTGHPNYDLGQYNDVASLQGLHNQLGQYIQSLQGVQNNYLTSGQLKGKLDAIAPSTSNLAGTLKGQIDKIIAGPGDSSAKLGIANTYISQLPADQQDPYKKYLQDQITPVLAASK